MINYYKHNSLGYCYYFSCDFCKNTDSEDRSKEPLIMPCRLKLEDPRHNMVPVCYDLCQNCSEKIRQLLYNQVASIIEENMNDD